MPIIKKVVSDGVVYDATEIFKKLDSLEGIASKKQLNKLRRSRAIQAIVFKDIISHFEDERGPSGKWRSWSDNYAKQLQKKGQSGNKILSASGTLRQSFIPGGSEVGTRASKGSLIWFNKLPYARIHDKGGTIKHPGTSDGFGKGIKIGAHDIKMPQRQYMWFSSKALDTLGLAFLKFVEKGGKFR